MDESTSANGSQRRIAARRRDATHSEKLAVAVKERLDDIAKLLDDEGYGKRSRVALTQALIFACPVEDPEHLALVIRVGTMRALNDIGWDNGDRLAEGEGDLGWYAESVDRSEIVAELRRVRRELGHMKWHLDDARKTLAGLLDEDVDAVA